MDTEHQQQRITTPCPACGAQSLFISIGGHITCSVVGCKNPIPAAVVDELRDAIRAAHGALVTIGGQGVLDDHGVTVGVLAETDGYRELMARLRAALHMPAPFDALGGR
jgi:hypothetical protein